MSKLGLETHTKGTGANMVPLEKERDAGGKDEPQFAVPRPRDRSADVPAPKRRRASGSSRS